MHRTGYIRSAIGVLVTFATLAGLAGGFGIPWFTFAVLGLSSISALAFLLIAAGGTRRLRMRFASVSRELLRYARAIESSTAPGSGLAVKAWQQHCEIERNGDCVYERTITLGDTSRIIPHYYNATFVSAGDDSLTDRAKREVAITVTRAPAAAPEQWVRVLSTDTWRKSRSDRDMLEVHIYLGDDVRDGDRVKVLVDWPSASSALRKGEASEEFDLTFIERSVAFKQTVVLRDSLKDPLVQPIEGTQFSTERIGAAYSITYWGDNAPLNSRRGVIIDYDSRRL